MQFVILRFRFTEQVNKLDEKQNIKFKDIYSIKLASMKSGKRVFSRHPLLAGISRTILG